MPLVHNWMFIDNSGANYELIAGGSEAGIEVYKQVIWETINKHHHEGRR